MGLLLVYSGCATEQAVVDDKKLQKRECKKLKPVHVSLQHVLYGDALMCCAHVHTHTLLQQREAEYEAEQRRIKREKEKEVARLRALQERDRDYKAEQV